MSTEMIHSRAARNGFDALREFDENSDGRIDNSDSVYSRLIVWFDLNHNGISEPSELVDLARVGVRAILTSFTETRRVDGYGNRYRFEGTALFARERTGREVARRIFDVFLVTAP